MPVGGRVFMMPSGSFLSFQWEAGAQEGLRVVAVKCSQPQGSSLLHLHVPTSHRLGESFLASVSPPARAP